ncbi:hypothetical protein ACOMHN_039088 [Nucella lapillus]
MNRSATVKQVTLKSEDKSRPFDVSGQKSSSGSWSDDVSDEALDEQSVLFMVVPERITKRSCKALSVVGSLLDAESREMKENITPIHLTSRVSHNRLIPTCFLTEGGFDDFQGQQLGLASQQGSPLFPGAAARSGVTAGSPLFPGAAASQVNHCCRCTPAAHIRDTCDGDITEVVTGSLQHRFNNSAVQFFFPQYEINLS